MANVPYTYKDPTTGATLAAEDSVALEQYEAEDGSRRAVLVGTRSQAAATTAIRVDVTKQFKTCLHGNPMEAIPDEYMSPLTAQQLGSSPADATLTVENTGAPTTALPRGLNASANDIIEIVDYFNFDTGLPNQRETAIIVTVDSATQITIRRGNATNFSNSYNKGAMVFNRTNTLPRWGTGRGINMKAGTKLQREAPTTNDLTVTPLTGPSRFDITPATESSSQLVRGRIRVYVRSSKDDRHGIIQPHWVPDAEIADTAFGTATSVTTYDGGSSAGGGSIAAGTYHIFGVRDDYTGAAAASLANTVVAKLSQVVT